MISSQFIRPIIYPSWKEQNHILVPQEFKSYNPRPRIYEHTGEAIRMVFPAIKETRAQFVTMSKYHEDFEPVDVEFISAFNKVLTYLNRTMQYCKVRDWSEKI